MTHNGRAVRGGRVIGRAALAIMVMVTIACAPVYRNHGYIPSDDELALIEVGVDTRDTVAVAVGRPSAAGLLNDLGWYYVQSRWKSRGALPPLEEDRQVVAITFAENGVVENVERFGLEQGRIVPISRRITESNVKGASFLRQLLGNIGGINTGDLLTE